MQIETVPSLDRKAVTVTRLQADSLHQKAKAFQQQFQKQQAQFSTSDDNVYYIVSSQFLREWRDYCTAHTLERYLPAPMNSNILENGKLKPELKQGEDFQFISQNLFEYFKDYEGTQIKRKVVKIGNEKRVPVYLNSYQYLALSQELIRSIDRKSIKSDDLETKTIEASSQKTIEELIQEIKEKERFGMDKNLRIWKIGKMSVENLYSHIKKQAAKVYSHFVKILLSGKKIDDLTLKIGELEFQQGEFLVVEHKDDFKQWSFYSDSEGKCDSCYSFAQLKFSCECKKIAYCSELCKEKDLKFHIKSCSFAEAAEFSRSIDMTITENSAKGRVGLSNLGNTCFMNSCLQCMSNTVPLTQYFLGCYFMNEINKVNPIGTNGKLARSYAKFIKSMWCDFNSTHSPYNIKNAVSSINPMFSGYAQHDSQEFFSFLVDGLHEDLNRIQTKPYVPSVESKGRPDQEVALESWIAYIKRNQSIIVDLMTGQYKSKVTCPDCKEESITFDPFITVTLPIPQTVVNFFPFFIIYSNMHKKTERLWLSYSKANAQEWLRTASEMTNLDSKKFGLYVVTGLEGLLKVGRQSITEILHKIESQNKTVFLIEYSEEDLQIKNPIEITFKFTKKSNYGSDNLWLKFPFLFDKSSIKGLQIYKKVLKFFYGQCYLFNQNNSQADAQTYDVYESKMLDQRPFSLILKYEQKIERTYKATEYQYDKEEKILDDSDIAEFISKLTLGQYEIEVRFEPGALSKYFDYKCLKDFDQIMDKPKQKSSDEAVVPIDQCFQHFREVEKLEAGNEWYCAKCKEHKQADKQLSIYKAPKILIIHLKRFKQKGTYRRQKNESKIQFPMELDMTQYLVDPTPMSSYIEEAKNQNVYIEPKVDKQFTVSQQPIYELYAVSNHYGGLGGGHYTAYAKNNDKWFEFNDSSVRACSEQSVCGSGAYMLFYKRKD